VERAYVELLGFLAGACTSLSFIPQILKIAKTGKVRDISVCMYLVLSSGIFLWLIYGINIGELPVIIANSVSFVFCLAILAMKMFFSIYHKAEAPTEPAGEEDRR
jgi:MtN3 and saliva related transmembrane protein